MATEIWEIRFRSRIRGPISDGRMERWLREYEHDCAEEIADAAQDVWVRNLRGSIRNPTPYYWTRIDTREITPTRYEVHDHGIIYGPWLESGEYTPRRRFEGYFSQERAMAEMQVKRRNIGRRILARYRSQGKLI